MTVLEYAVDDIAQVRHDLSHADNNKYLKLCLTNDFSLFHTLTTAWH